MLVSVEKEGNVRGEENEIIFTTQQTIKLLGGQQMLANRHNAAL